MDDPRLRLKVDLALKMASDRGLDLREAPLLVTFELPIWGASLETHEFAELARRPGTAVAVVSNESLPETRRSLASSAPGLHVIAERGLLCGLSGGNVLPVYPSQASEMRSFAVALFAGLAPRATSLAMRGYLSSGRQEVSLHPVLESPAPSARELQHAIRVHGGAAALAGNEEEFVVVDDVPGDLEALHGALNDQFPGAPVALSRLPSGRFRLRPGARGRELEHGQAQVVAQEIAISCDRFVDARGRTTVGFSTESVAKREYDAETAARKLAGELFGAPDTVVTHLGLQPFVREGSLFFAYEGSEAILEAARSGQPVVAVRDILEYARVLNAIRRGK